MSEQTEWVVQYIKQIGSQYLADFASCPQSDLAKYDSSLGRVIRNHFSMWSDHWEPMIINGVDCSPSHPDQRSHALMLSAWKNLQEHK